MEMLLRVAEAGLGVAVLPPLAVKAGETRLTTLKLITEKVSLERHMAIATRQNESQATNHLRAFLEASLSQQREYEPAD
jgi:DNA-binding transcriptional LysR family regulator